MTSDPTQLAPARFYGFARTRTAAENFPALKPPDTDDSSSAAVVDTPCEDEPKAPEPSADSAPSSLALVSKPKIPVAEGQIIDVAAAPEIAELAPPPANPRRSSFSKRRSPKESRSRRKTSRTRRRIAKAAPEPTRRLSRLELHQAHCSICGSELQEEIDKRFVNWECVRQIADDYSIDRSALYRHAHATRLMAKRDRNIRRALCHIIHNAGRVDVTADSVVRAVKTFAHINARGEWVNPPSHVVFTTAAPRPAKPARVDAKTSGTPSHLISSPNP